MDKAEKDALKLCQMPLDRPLFPDLVQALRERDEEIAKLRSCAQVYTESAAILERERDQLRAERDLAVEALQTIDKAPGTYRGNLLVIARKALAKLPHAGERARLVSDVVAATREWGSKPFPAQDTNDGLSAALDALDAFDRAQGGGEK